MQIGPLVGKFQNVYLPVLESDPWLSQMLGKPAYRLSLVSIAAAGSFSQPRLPSLAANQLENPVFLYCKVASNSVESSLFLQDHGFRLVDTNVTFEKKNESLPTVNFKNVQIRWALTQDQPAIVEIAQHSFRFSRFHMDPNIPLETANRIKGEWTSNFFSGKRGNSMAVAEVSGKAAGYLLLLETQNTITIDLIAVGESFRKIGVASKLISWVQSQRNSFHHFQVGTQIANVASIRCYQKLGFSLADSQYVFHYHGPMPNFLTGEA